VSQPKICPRCGESYDDATAFCAKDGARLVRGGLTSDLIGTVIAERYRVVSRIGEGGMGQVYLAEHVRMKRKSAIKIMRPSLVGEVEALQRFTREAENASQLSHPNIAAIFDFGETPDGVVYLAMEYIDGESLAAKLDQYVALHPDVAADILGQAADALQAAHDVNMLHRDIKPDNIMLGKRNDGTYMVKLVDFGIARTMDGNDQRLTRTGFAVGTPQYMSPEQLSGDVLDASSDQYSLALVAFFALTGKHAFPSESSKESLIARLTSRPRTLQDAKQDVQWPEALQEIFNRALSPEPGDRFPTVSDFAHALAGAISNMTPSQTAELYRRALDVRVASVAARTPHSDMELLRTPSGSVATMGTPSGPREVLRTGPNATATGGVGNASTGSRETTGTTPTNASTGTSSVAPEATGAAALVGGASSAAPPAGAHSDGAADAQRGAASPQPAPRARWPFIIGGVITASVAATLVFSRRGDDTPSTSDTAATVAVLADSARAMPALADSLRADSASRTGSGAMAPAGAATTGAKPAGTSTSTPPAAAGASTANAPKVSAADSARRVAARDSARRETQRKAKATADSIAQANNVRARYPDAAARAMLARGVDAKARMAKNDDIRAVIMPTPVFVWRAEQARAWKDAHPMSAGTPYPMVDPIEQWSAWTAAVNSRRAVYVIEVTTDRAPWPSYEPEKIFDIKRGDVDGVDVLRDGAPVPLDASSRVPAVVNGPAHLAAGKRLTNTFVAMLAPTTFNPREDGSLPKIEIIVRDALRNGATTKITLNQTLVRRLYDDFAPWRDALVKQ
jgi:serine/threonine-protein kinase